MSLLALMTENCKIVSVIGMSKNAGKTVALNEIIFQAMEEEKVLGLTSIGRDGERQDIVTCTEKPMIYIDRGTLIATAENLFQCAEAKLEILEVTDYNTSMGRIVIARAVTAGHVEIAGACTNSSIRDTAEKMLAYGAELVLVDGALDRISSASPAITDATVLSTGAVLSRDMNKVLEQSVHRVRLFNMEAVSDEVVRTLAKELMDEKQIGIITNTFEVQVIEVKTALGAGAKIGEAIGEDALYVVIPGSLVTKTITDLMMSSVRFKQVTFIIADATKIFIEHRDWNYFVKMGLKVEVMDAIRLLAVTVNPYAPQGYYFDPKTFKDKMTTYLEPVPVFNVMEVDRR